MQFNSLPDTAFVRMSSLASYAKQGKHGILPVSAATIWTWVKKGQFPKPLKISDRVTAWRASDIRQYLSNMGVPE